ncbi:MAG: pyruvate kinase [Anaerovoracaceae bacterium]|jgi:pyruvate kinase
MRKTKIICTIGPVSDSEDVLKALMIGGMNVARLNFSHGNHEDHLIKINRIKRLREELGLHVAILLDTKGPEIRTGRFKNETANLVEGQTFILTTEEIVGDEKGCSVSFKNLSKNLAPKDRIMLDDGLIRMCVDSIEGGNIHCTVENCGIISGNKSINIPEVKIDLPALTPQDMEDIILGIENGVDYIAASFIRKAEDILSIRRLLDDNGGEDIRLISKIENREGLENIDEIIENSDGIMVARGDLGVEIPTQEVPIAQKEIIRKCNDYGVVVVTATQMLDSMIRNPRPTRAEVADVANAIFDGTDGIMLSGETASGEYPIESLAMMDSIARTVESSIDYHQMQMQRSEIRDRGITNAIGHATCTAAQGLGVKAILTPTTSGHTAFAVARFRPEAPILSGSSDEKTVRRLALCWGAHPMKMDLVDKDDDVFRSIVSTAQKTGILKDGDRVIITAGFPVGIKGNTNSMRIHVIGQEL